MKHRILFVTSLYKPHVGGIETFVSSMCRELIKRGHSTFVLTKRYPHDLPQNEIIDGTAVYRLSRPIEQYQLDETSKLIGQFLEMNRISLVHIVGIRRPLPILVTMEAKKLGIPIVAQVAGGDLPHAGDLEAESLWEECKDDHLKMLSLVDRVLAFSNYLAELCAQNSQINSSKISVIHAPVTEVEHLELDQPRDIDILCARRLVPSKGVSHLLQAIRYSKYLQTLNTVIVGDGPEKQRLEYEYNDLVFSGSVIFKESVTLSELYALYLRSKVHVCPSLSEGGGTCNVESAFCRALPLGSTAGGIREYLPDALAKYSFNPGDYVKLAQVLEEILKNDKERDGLVEIAHQFSRKFSFSNLFDKYMDLYDGLITKGLQ